VRPLLALITGGVLLTGLALPAGSGWSWQKPVVNEPAKATAAVYVYEKDDHAIPTYVTVGINRLNRERRIVATLFEADTTDGTGDVPEQYRSALDAARHAGLPALVVLSGTSAIGVVPAPATEAAIVEAVP
jgi:hypothetical protein